MLSRKISSNAQNYSGKGDIFFAFLTLLLVIFGVYKSTERNAKIRITSDTNVLQGEISGQENLIDY